MGDKPEIIKPEVFLRLKLGQSDGKVFPVIEDRIVEQHNGSDIEDIDPEQPKELPEAGA